MSKFRETFKNIIKATQQIKIAEVPSQVTNNIKSNISVSGMLKAGKKAYNNLAQDAKSLASAAKVMTKRGGQIAVPLGVIKGVMDKSSDPESQSQSSGSEPSSAAPNIVTHIAEEVKKGVKELQVTIEKEYNETLESKKSGTDSPNKNLGRNFLVGLSNVTNAHKVDAAIDTGINVALNHGPSAVVGLGYKIAFKAGKEVRSTAEQTAKKLKDALTSNELSPPSNSALANIKKPGKGTLIG